MDVFGILHLIENPSSHGCSERIAGMARKEKKVRIFSALEVADICGVVNQTAINWIRNGFLKAFTTPGGQYRVYLEDLLEFLTSRGMRVPPELVEKAGEEPAWQRILIVDDDETINTLLKKYFARKLPAYTVRQAFDGFEAGTLLSEWKPGIVLLDINLPGVDGHKLCQRIKSGNGALTPVVIAITGLTDSSIQEAIMREGADAFFAKPLDLDKLKDRIEGLVAARQGKGGPNEP
jgi:two-component system OmpR family response regulator